MVDGTTTIEQLLSATTASALDTLSDDALVEFANNLLALWGRLDAARLRVIAAVDTRGVFRRDGSVDMPAWLARHAGDRRGTAHRDVDLATALSAMTVVADALSDGTLSRAKATELARIADAPPTEQAALVDAARRQTPEQVARAVDRWQLEHGAGPEPVEETCTITPTAGGGRIEATLDAESLEWVQVAVDTAADRLGLRGQPWGHRRARGLVSIARYFLDHADLPATRVGRPTVVITVDVDTVAAATGGTARLDSGAHVTGDVARRLACDAGIVRVITDAESMPLDVGRKTRVPSPAQARAVIHRDRHCRIAGCTAPPWACEVHHLDFWTRDHGRTDLDRLALICWYHHSLVHKQSATHDLIADGDGRLTLRPRQRPPTEADAA